MSPWFPAGAVLKTITNISENKTMLQIVCRAKYVPMTTLKSETSVGSNKKIA
jgi:hypothetical protein